MSRATVPQVIPVHRSDHDVFQVHVLTVCASCSGFVRIRGQWPAVGHVTERAAAGADFPQDHEGGRALGETFVDVRTAGFLADGDQLPRP